MVEWIIDYEDDAIQDPNERYNYLMQLENLLRTSTYTDEQIDEIQGVAEESDIFTIIDFINKALLNQLHPIYEKGNYSTTDIIKRLKKD